jgi:hypothetical protein
MDSLWVRQKADQKVVWKVDQKAHWWVH